MKQRYGGLKVPRFAAGREKHVAPDIAALTFEKPGYRPQNQISERPRSAMPFGREKRLADRKHSGDSFSSDTFTSARPASIVTVSKVFR